MSTHRDDKCVSSGSSWTVYMLTFINAGSLNFRFHKSWWPLSVCPGSRESRPAQADWINQLNEAAMEIQTSWLIFLERYHDVFSRYWNTRWNVAPECVGVSSGEDRDLFWKHAYVTLLYRLLCLSDLCCKQCWVWMSMMSGVYTGRWRTLSFGVKGVCMFRVMLTSALVCSACLLWKVDRILYLSCPMLNLPGACF